jgi:hypothetical protein
VPSYSELKRWSIEKQPEPAAHDDSFTRTPGALIYALVVAWLLLAYVPIVLLSFANLHPLAGVGIVLLVTAQIWLFTLIFSGNPAAALVVLLVPVVGSVLALQFVLDHWRLARWPVVCQLAGFVAFFMGLSLGLR